MDKMGVLVLLKRESVTYILRHRRSFGTQRHTWTNRSRNFDFSGCLGREIQTNWELMSAVTRREKVINVYMCTVQLHFHSLCNRAEYL